MLPSNFKALLLVLVGLLAADARAADPVDKAREDLDRQLREMVQIPPPEVVVTFEGLPPQAEGEGYKLVEAEFLVDGEALATPEPEALNAPGSHRLLVNQLPEGTHTLVSRVTYVNDSWSLFSETNGYLWKMTATVSFQMQRGLRVRVKVVPAIVPKAKDPRLKLKLTHDVAAEMTAELADATLPEPVSATETPPTPVATPQPTGTQPTGTQPTGTQPTGTQPTGTQPAGAQAKAAARLALKVLARKKPVAATVFVRGAQAPQQLTLDRKARKPATLELAAGTYTVEVVAKGFLAQTRRVRLAEGVESKVAFSLVPAKKGQQAQLKGDRVELAKPPSYAEKQPALRKPVLTALVPQLMDVLVREPGTRLRIEGHTDSREVPADARQPLSDARARAVAEALIRAGVDPSRIEMAGLGDSRPKAPNLTPRGRQTNRRVEFVLLRK